MGTTLAQSSIFAVQVALLAPVISLSLALVIFGVYALLFGTLIYFLRNGKVIVHQKLFVIWAISVFLISSVGALANASSGIQDAVVLYNALRTQNYGPFLQYVTQDETQTALTGVTYTFLVAVNCLADAVLIHRIYLVWGSRRWTLALPILTSMAINAVGLAGTIMRTKGASNSGIESNFNLEAKGINFLLGFYYANAVVNFIFTMLIAGRIWWIGHTEQSQNRLTNGKYKSTVAIILECGVLYPISLVAHAAIEGNVDKIAIPVNLTPTVILLAGVAPTVIILRSCLGLNITREAVNLHGSSHTQSLSDSGHLDEKDRRMAV
jgi:hypothetical protein